MPSWESNRTGEVEQCYRVKWNKNGESRRESGHVSVDNRRLRLHIPVPPVLLLRVA